MVGIFSDFKEEYIEEYITKSSDKDDRSERFPAEIIEDCELYLKVGLYCGWSWKEFEETPVLVRDYISEEIDRRLKPYIDSLKDQAAKSGGSGKGLLPLDFNHLGILLALASAFNGSE